MIRVGIVLSGVLAMGMASAAGDAAASPLAANDATNLDRLVQAVERAMPSGRHLEGLVTRSVWMARPGEPVPDPQRDPPGLTDAHLVRLLGPGRAVVAPRGLVQIRVLADGDTYVRTLGEGSAYVERGTLDNGGLGLALLLQVDLFNPADLPRALAATIRDSAPIALTVDGDRAVYRFTDRAEQAAIDAQVLKFEQQGTPPPWPVRPTAWVREVTVDLGEPPRVLGWAVEVPRDGLDKPTVRDEWTVETWQLLDAAPLPSRIRRTTRLNNVPYVQVTELTRASPIPPPAAEGDAAPSRPLPEGLVVRDERQGFTFTVGSREVHHQGRNLRLKEALWVHPGDRLPAILADAVEW